MTEKKESWEEAYRAAEVALVHAQTVIDDIAGWSGSSGNWPLQQCSGQVRRALEILHEPDWPHDCECFRKLNAVTEGVWFGPCEDTRNHKSGCPVAIRAAAKGQACVTTTTTKRGT